MSFSELKTQVSQKVFDELEEAIQYPDHTRQALKHEAELAFQGPGKPGLIEKLLEKTPIKVPANAPRGRSPLALVALLGMTAYATYEYFQKSTPQSEPQPWLPSVDSPIPDIKADYFALAMATIAESIRQYVNPKLPPPPTADIGRHAYCSEDYPHPMARFSSVTAVEIPVDGLPRPPVHALSNGALLIEPNFADFAANRLQVFAIEAGEALTVINFPVKPVIVIILHNPRSNQQFFMVIDAEWNGEHLARNGRRDFNWKHFLEVLRLATENLDDLQNLEIQAIASMDMTFLNRNWQVLQHWLSDALRKRADQLEREALMTEADSSLLTRTLRAGLSSLLSGPQHTKNRGKTDFLALGESRHPNLRDMPTQCLDFFSTGEAFYVNQKGQAWIAPIDRNIFMSMVIDPNSSSCN